MKQIPTTKSATGSDSDLSDARATNIRHYIGLPFIRLASGVRDFFAFYRWMTEWDRMVDPPPLKRDDHLPITPLVLRIAVEVVSLVLVLGMLFWSIWLFDSGLEVPWYLSSGIGLLLVIGGAAGQARLPKGWRPSVTLFGALSAGVVILCSTLVSPAGGNPTIVDPSISVERSILRYVLIATTLFVARDTLFAYRPLMNWRESPRILTESLTGVLSLAATAGFIWLVAIDLPALILSALMVATLFAAAYLVTNLPENRLPRLVLIVLPVALVITWVHLVLTPFVLRVDTDDASRTAEISTLVALVFLYELASSRYHRRREKVDLEAP